MCLEIIVIKILIFFIKIFVVEIVSPDASVSVYATLSRHCKPRTGSTGPNLSTSCAATCHGLSKPKARQEEQRQL